MDTTLSRFEELCSRGEATEADCVKAYGEVMRLAAENDKKRDEAARVNKWKQVSVNYAAKMARRFGLTCGMGMEMSQPEESRV